MPNESITDGVDKVINDLYKKLKIKPEWNLENWTDECVHSRRQFYTEFLTQLVTMKFRISPDKFKS